MIGSVKFSDLLTIVPWVVICPPGRIAVVGHWASTLSALAVDTNVQTTPIATHLLAIRRRRLPENTTVVTKAEARSADVDVWIKLREHGRSRGSSAAVGVAG